MCLTGLAEEGQHLGKWLDLQKTNRSRHPDYWKRVKDDMHDPKVHTSGIKMRRARHLKVEDDIVQAGLYTPGRDE